jgi:hypothetical protein
MKRTAIASLIGALIFGIGTTWFGPRMIAYWFTQPVPTAFNCTPQIDWAMHNLILAQMIGTLIGLVIGLVIGILMRKKSPAVPSATPVKPA